LCYIVDEAICPSDEIRADGHLRCQAELAGAPCLLYACNLVDSFSWGSQVRTFNLTANLCSDESIEILRGRISHVEAARDFRALVQRDLT
jgi:hypothetical protein